jgi:putative nucleotide binding protein
MSKKGTPPEKEDYAWVLDYLPYGSTTDKRPAYQKKPLVQAIGDKHFALMELVPKEGANPEIQSKVYVGDGDRDVIDHVKHRIHFDDLSHGAQLELPFVLEICVKDQEDKFVNFGASGVVGHAYMYQTTIAEWYWESQPKKVKVL